MYTRPHDQPGDRYRKERIKKVKTNEKYEIMILLTC